jgi:amino acid adenylation domain-containing protein/non-ribosomal peptide synthase protein (TIGR01720 family)
MLSKQNIKDIYPLSPMQEGMLFHFLVDENSHAYFEQSTYTLNGSVDIELIEKSIQYLIERHDILRTVFAYKNVSRPFQVVLKQVDFKLNVHDVSHKNESEQIAFFEQLKQSDFNTPFKLGEDILLRIIVVKCSDSKFRIIWSHHHILMDGWCMGVILGEFLQIYKSYKNDKLPVLPSVVPYSNYIKWLESRKKDNSKSFWKKQLSSVTERASLSSFEGKTSGFSKKVVKYSFDSKIVEGIKRLTVNNGITANTIFQTAWGILLHKYNFTSNALFGAVVAGRPAEIPNVESVLGLFINTIPVKVDTDSKADFLTLAKDLQANASERMEHEYLSLAEIAEQSVLKKDLFDHILVYENFPAMPLEQIDESEFGFKINDLNTFEQTNYELNLIFFPKGEDILIKYDFNENKYSTKFIESVHQSFTFILQQVTEQPEIKLSEIKASSASFPKLEFTKPTQTVVSKFVEMANGNSDSIALEFNNKKITFKELNQLSNQLAKFLKENHSIEKGDFVGLLADRSDKLIITIIALLKIGACYIPIDTSNPDERVNYMLSDSNAKLLITDKKTVSAIPVLDINTIEGLGFSDELVNEAELNDLAYIIYTSGSTGLPKGCKLTHSNLAHYIQYANKTYFEDSIKGDTALFTSISFDLTITAIFTPLTRGAKLLILPQKDDIKSLLYSAFNKQNGLTFLKITPAHAALLPHINLSETSVKSIVVGGEELKREHLSNLFFLNKTLKLYNEYGPTETTVGCSVKRIVSENDFVSIGNPIENMEMIVLDEFSNPLSNGAIGEIYIGGNGVGEGYLNKLELTEQKFVEINNSKWYKTGDLGVKLLTDEFQFLGRIDTQAKIRGYRIETGEIEFHLLQLPFIKNAFVTVNSDNLCAYFVTSQSIDKQQVNSVLAKSLPAYMLPDVYITIENMPLTVNGKVDVKALPSSFGQSTKVYTAPVTETEIKLAELWKQVLGVEQVGLDDNFFELGGHSLKTTILSSLIAKNFQKEIKIKQLFEFATLKSQAHLIEKGDSDNFIALEKAPKQDFYELSYSQKQIWVVQQIDKASIAYNIPASRKLIGDLNKEAFEKAFHALFERHESLRTNFVNSSGEPKMIVKDNFEFKLPFTDISNNENKNERLNKFESENQNKPFNLESDTLLRVQLLKIDTNEYVLLFAMHHIISDGWSMEIVISEVSTLYNSFLTNSSNPFPPLNFQYKDYLLWENKMLSGERLEKQKDFWKNHFQGGINTIQLPYDFAKTKQTYNGKLQVFYISTDEQEQLKNAAKNAVVTLNVYLLAVLNVFLAKISNQNEITLRTITTGRNNADLQNIIGYFIRVFGVKNTVESGQGFKSFLQTVNKRFIEVLDNDLYPYEMVLQDQNAGKTLSDSLNVDYYYQNIETLINGHLEGLKGVVVKELSAETTITKNDLTLTVYEKTDSIEFALNYNTDLFTDNSANRLVKIFKHVLAQLTANTIVSLDKITLLNQSECIKPEFYSTSELPQKTIFQLFEEQVAQTPNALAVQLADKSLSYKELNEYSNKLAHFLISKGVKTETIVPLLVERSIEMVIGLFGIMKAGAAYLPIDPDLPKERIEYMLEDSQSTILLSLSYLNKADFKGKFDNIDEIIKADLPITNPDLNIHPDNLAYVIYTSGSTGRPKGTMLQHRGVVNRLFWMYKKFDFTANDRVIQKTTYSFDVSVWEFFTTLCFGSQLVLCPKEVIYDPKLLIDFIEKNKISLIHFVPSMFNMFLSELNEGNKHKIKSIRHIFTSGEALSLEAVKKHHKINNIPLHNMYGPTEASVEVSAYITSENDTEVPIGKAIDNINLYVLDKNLNPLPIGIPGELHIAGVGVARGYHNKAELTNEKFVDNPFGEGKLYKTGDLCKFREDGNIIYLGRIDQQVKIRGYRIELGEIEEQIRAIDGINDAAVIAKEINGELTLCSYFVSTQNVSPETIKTKLSAVLPEYMIPAFIISIDKIPLNANGKLDRKALPEPTYTISLSGTLPKTESELKLLAIWIDILKTENVFLESDFFALGGHSLRATVLVARIEKAFEVKLPLAEIFRNRTLQSQIQLIASYSKTSVSTISKAPELSYYPLSDAQRRLYFLQQMEGVKTAYHLPSVIVLEGAIDANKLEKAAFKVINQHASLRTSFHLVNHEPAQKIHDSGKFKLEVLPYNENIEKVINQFIKPFNLEEPTQWRMAIMSKSDSEHFLLFDMHHIITDGTSLGILVKDLLNSYNNNSVQSAPITYHDFAYWQQTEDFQQLIAKEEQFWIENFKEEIPTLELPTDFPRPAHSTFEGSTISFTLNKEITEKIKKLADSEQSTLFMALLSIYHVFLKKYTNQNDIVIGSPVAGRSLAELQTVIGMFVNTLPLRINSENKQSFTEVLKKVTNNTLEAFDNQHYPFEKLIEKLEIPRKLNRNPLFDTMFVLQNTEKEAIKLEDLTVKPYSFENKTAKFDLTLNASENEGVIEYLLEYNTALFTKETVKQMANHFVQLTQEIISYPDKSIQDFSLLTKDEENELLVNFNQTNRAYPVLSVIDLFLKQVETNPDAIALEFGNEVYSYSKLNNLADGISNYLTSNYPNEQLIAVCMDRSEKVIATILGILKAGKVYIPIDKSVPVNRIQYILQNSAAKVLFADFDLNINVHTILIHEKWNELVADTASVKKAIQPDSLAYIIYTSGSTGNPKGCKIAHSNLSNYIQYASETYFDTDNGNFGLYTSLSFDLTITSIFGALCRGKKLYVYPNWDIQDILAHSFSLDSGIDAVKITPAHITILQHLPIIKTNIQVAVVGGEALLPMHVEILRKLNPKIKIFNEYGPTETTVGCIVKEIGNESEILIGKPIANTQIYLLDSNLKPVPKGVYGEIWIAGLGVGLGYVNNEKLTQERFITNPFTAFGKMYKSGDLARFIASGEIDYLGRIDEQVKIKGYRIELGEIEHKITQVKNVNEAVVIVKADKTGENQLCAYFSGDAAIDTIKSALNKELPNYMIPAYFIQLEKIPLTTNGKIDKRALPEPVLLKDETTYQAPVTQTETVLAELWEQLLLTEKVGVLDDFFFLGGDSIKAIQLISRLRTKGYSLQLKDVFENSCLADMAKKLKHLTKTISQEEVVGTAPLTAIQKEFLNGKISDKNHYNQSVMLFNANGFDSKAIQLVFEKIIQHHDALRLKFVSNQQENSAFTDINFSVEVFNGFSENEIEKTAQKLQKTINIGSAPLLKVAIFHTDKGSHLLIIIHHLVIDGVSWRILLEDFDTIYQSVISNESIAIPEKTNSFIEWANGVNELANSDRFLRKQQYWLSDKLTQDAVPFFKIAENNGFERVKISFTESQTKQLLKNVSAMFNADLNEILLAALVSGLDKLKPNDTFSVLLEGHGRENILPELDISRTIGWFTSVYPVSLKTYTNCQSTLIHTKETLRIIPDKGIGYGIIKELTENSKKQNFRTNNPQVVFNFLGDFDSTLKAKNFEISKLSTGENSAQIEKEFAIELNGLIASKMLSFDLDFNNNYLTDEHKNLFVTAFQEAIDELIQSAVKVHKSIKSPSDFGLENVSVEELNYLLENAKGEIEKIYPLSPMQQGMLFHNLMDDEEAYFEQTIITLSGNFDIKLFETTFNNLIARHEILRSNIIADNLIIPHQVIFKEKYASVYFENITQLNQNLQDEHIEAFMQNEKMLGLDLTKDMLMKISVFQTAEETIKLVWTHHHIIIDGWCLGIILNDFFTIYNQQGDSSNLKPAQPYSNYIKWLQEQDKKTALKFWTNVLDEVELKTEIPFKKKIKAENYKPNHISLVLSENENNELASLAANLKVTPYTLLQTIWGIQLQKYNSANYAVFGSVVSGRPPQLEGIEQMVGLFINTIPVKISRNQTFKNTVIAVQEQNTKSGEFDFIPLNEIVSLTPLKNELINHLMIYENYPLDKKAKDLNDKNSMLTISEVKNFERTNYDFTITVLPTENLTISFDFNENAFEFDGIKSIKESFYTLLKQVLANPDCEIKKLELLSDNEKNQLLEKTKALKITHPTLTVAELFKETALKYADSVALRYNSKIKSYKELDFESDKIAAYLQSKGVTTNKIVGIYAKPNFEMMVGLMGILKSGAAYLPIDTNYPTDRIQYMLEDSGATIVLYNTDLPVDLKTESEWVELATLKENQINVELKPVKSHPDDLAYIIYTSGSTGKPKGVMVTQANFSDYIFTIKKMFGISEKDIMLQHASIAFDTTIEELYPVLCSGGSLYLPKDTKNFEEILYNFEHNNITLFCTSPLVLNYINQEAKNVGILRLITVGGDELKAKYVDKLIGKVDIWNGYGPTESTVCATYYQLKGNEVMMPIGKPFINRSSYILNHDENLLPYGLPGELCVGGNGVTKGYLNRPDLTAEKFISTHLEESKVYKTGDLCSWDENGDILFYGRIDSQVKIRGFRIELGEIEAQLLKFKGVNEAVVLAWNDDSNSKFLAAYITGEVNQAELKAFLERELPEYMVPAYFVMLEKMPLTINGKTDRKALKRPDLIALVAENYIAPENEIQEIIAKVWEEILGVKAGIDNNFFALGGDSIKAIQMVSRIQKYNLKTEVKDLFKNPTIRLLAPLVRNLTIIANQGALVGEVQLIPIQKAFLEENLLKPNHYNQSVILKSEQRITIDKLKDSLNAIYKHHDTLRAVLNDGKLIVKPFENLSVEIIENKSIDFVQKHIQQTQESFDLSNGKLFKAVLYRMDDADHLFLVAHHLVIDGISWRILLEDLQTLLSGKAELPLKSHSIKEWSDHLIQYAQSDELKKELPFWTEIDNLNPIVETVENKYADNKRVSIELETEQTNQLLKQVNDAYNTEINDILLAALINALTRFNTASNQVIFLEGHGREELFETIDISRTIGWFTSMYPVAFYAETDKAKHIKNTKETLRKIPKKGIGYGILKYLTGNTMLKAKPAISFNYLGQFDDTFKNSSFGVSNLGTGYDVSLDNSKETLLDVSGMVVNGKLKMDFMYNPKLTPIEKIETLKQDFKNELLAIISHCLEKDVVEKTVSDFDSKDLSEEELGDIMDMFDDL